MSVCMWVNYLGFYLFRYNCFDICFVSIVAFSLGWTKLGLIYLYLSMQLKYS